MTHMWLLSTFIAALILLDATVWFLSRRSYLRAGEDSQWSIVSANIAVIITNVIVIAVLTIIHAVVTLSADAGRAP